MPNEVNIYTPRYLAEVVRLAPPVYTFFRDTFFTNVHVFPTKAIDFDLVKGDRRMAAFVHPRNGAKVLSSAGYETLSYKPPLINPYDITTADQLMNRLPGEEMYSGMTPAQRAAQKQVEEYNRLNDSVIRREEWMCAQAIMTGQIPIVGEGVNEIVDFGFTNKKKLTGTAVWGGDKAAIADNLRDWKHEVAVNGFANVDMCVMGWKALGLFLADLDIRSRLDTKNYGYGAINVKQMSCGKCTARRMRKNGSSTTERPAVSESKSTRKSPSTLKNCWTFCITSKGQAPIWIRWNSPQKKRMTSFSVLRL